MFSEPGGFVGINCFIVLFCPAKMMLSVLLSLCWNHSDSAPFRSALPPRTFGCNHGPGSMWKCLTQAGHCSFPFPFPLTEAQGLSICSMENSQMVSYLGSDFVAQSRSFCCILAVIVLLEKKSAPKLWFSCRFGLLSHTW